VASYHTFDPSVLGSPKPAQPVVNRIWSYENPSERFKAIKDYLSFYASSSIGETGDGVDRWRCEIDGEVVVPQEGFANAVPACLRSVH
jgi:hypothetical protein